MPRHGQYTQQQADDLLKDYIRPEECASTGLPRDIAPDLVSNYIRNKLKPDFNHAEMGRAMRVARFYVLSDRVDQLLGMLNGDARDANELHRACHLIVAICELGQPKQQDQALNVYNRLVAGRIAEDAAHLERLVETFFYLPVRTNKKLISDRVTQLRADAERKGDNNQLWRFEECERRLFPWVIQEKARRDWLLKMPSGPERNQKWAEAYLMYDMNTPFKWDEAAGFGLLRQARDAGDQAVVEALRVIMERIDPNKDDPSIVTFRKTRGYNARAFFLEPFDRDTQQDAKDSAVPQDDLIR